MTFVLFMQGVELFGQSPVVVGAEIDKMAITPGGRADINIKLFTRYAPKDSLFIDWGDGTINLRYDPSPYYWPEMGIYAIVIYAYHYYDAPGYYTLELVERNIADSVLNIENSGEKAMILRDTILIPSLEQPFIYLNAHSMMPIVNTFSELFWEPEEWEDNNGTQIFRQQCNCVRPQVGYLEYSLEPFPAEGAEPLPATNGVHIEPNSYNECLLVWDNPVAPGRYGFGLKTRQFMRDLENPTDTTLLATTLRAVILDLDSTMTLTSTGMPGFEGLISLYPNPAINLLQLQIGGFHAPVQLRIFDALGREVYETQVDAASQVETLRIPVAAWPQGVYSVQIESGGKVLTQQVAVQR
ncbi:MAG: T9SS type A sorting domain-containing protein [Saprospiraceae bacterium]